MTRQYHVKLNGNGYLVDENPAGTLKYTESSPNPLSMKTSEGDAKLTDMTHLSHYIQNDWRGGRGKDVAEGSSRFADSGGLLTHYQEQVSLQPQAHLVGMLASSQNVPGLIDFNPPVKLTSTSWRLAQSFQTAGNETVNTINLLLRSKTSGILPDTDATISIRVETNGGDSKPSGSLVTNASVATSVALTPIYGWYQFSFAGAVSLTASTTYWIVIAYTGSPVADVDWASNGDQNTSDIYAIGRGASSSDSGTNWTLRDEDFYFLFEEVGDLPSHPVKSLVFNNIFYLAASTGLYKITAGVWVGVKVNFAASITDMDVLDNVLWIATGSGNVAWTMDTNEAFTVKTGINGQILHKFGGYLYRGNASTVYYTTDGTTWTTVGDTAGDSNTNILGMAGLNDTLYIGKPEGLFALAPGDQLVPIERWDTQYDANNGTGMVEWNGAIYIPVKYGLIRYDGNDFSSVGPDQEEGLPKLRIGKIVSMVPLLNYLIVAVDASGSTEYSSVLLYNGRGWHEVGRSWRAGARVRMAGYDYSSTPQRLYYGVGNWAAYLEFSDDADNPKVWQPSAFEPSGYLETPWINGGLADIWKVISDIWVQMELIGSGAPYDATTGVWYVGLEVDYQVDRSGFWVDASKIAGQYIDRLAGDTISLKQASTVTAAAVTAVNNTTGVITFTTIPSDIGKGDWVKIANESRQVKSVSGNTFTATVPYDNAAVGDTADDGYPSGREVKFRFRFYTQDVDTSPLMKALRFRYANQLTAWKQYSFVIRCEQNMQRLDLSAETRTAKQLHDELQELASEGNQLILFNDVYEVDRKVQLTDLTMPNMEFIYDTGSGLTTASWLATVNLIEV